MFFILLINLRGFMRRKNKLMFIEGVIFRFLFEYGKKWTLYITVLDDNRLYLRKIFR